MEFFSKFRLVSGFRGFSRSLTKYLYCCYIIDQYYWGSRGLMDRALDLKPEVTQGCGFESRLWQEVSTTEVRPLSMCVSIIPFGRDVSQAVAQGHMLEHHLLDAACA